MLKRTFEDYIRGKRIVFVGACPNLRGRADGSSIDSFDVVVKTNGSIYFDSPEYFRDYGSRIDVLYTNNQFYREMWPFPFHILRDRGVKYLRMKRARHRDLRLLRAKAFNAGLLTGALNRVNEMVHGAVMGLYLAEDILRCAPAELCITGIDFFVSKKKHFVKDDYREYLDGYLPGKIRRQGNVLNAKRGIDGHDMLANAQAFVEIQRRSRGVLCFPPFIQELLEDILSGKVHQAD